MSNLLETSILEAWDIIDKKISGSITSSQMNSQVNSLYGKTAALKVATLVSSGQTATQRTNVLTTEQEIALKIAVAYYLQNNNLSNTALYTSSLTSAQTLATYNNIDLNSLTQTVMNDVVPTMLSQHQGYKKYLLPGALLIGGLILIFILTKKSKSKTKQIGVETKRMEESK